MDALGIMAVAAGAAGTVALGVLVLGRTEGSPISAEDLAPYRDASINVDTSAELRRLAVSLGLSGGDGEDADVLQSGQE